MASELSSHHSIVIESNPTAIVGACKEILSELTAKAFSQEDVFAVHLAVQEAFINALKHGNKMDSTKKVRIDYCVSSDKVDISMTDEGCGFEPEDVPDPRCGENIYKANGRGLLLMRSYMDMVEYNDCGNCVHLVRYREKPKLAGTGQ
jgi:serine/threonine-protein kinase RsbW